MELKQNCWIDHCCSCRSSFPTWTLTLHFSTLKHLPLSPSWRDWGSPWRWCRRKTAGHCRWSGRTWNTGSVWAHSCTEKRIPPAGGTAAREIHLCESFHIVADDLRVGTLQLADDFKALIELGEHVDHGAGEQSVLRRDLELESQKKRQDWGVGEGIEAYKGVGADAAAALLSNIKHEGFGSRVTSAQGAATRSRRWKWVLLGWEPRRRSEGRDGGGVGALINRAHISK